MSRNKTVVLFLMLCSCLLASLPVFADTDTPTPTVTSTPTITCTPINTPNPSDPWKNLGWSLNVNGNHSAVNPRIAVAQNGTPYVVWVESNTTNAGKQIFVKSWDGNNWNPVGDSLSINYGGNANYPAITFDGSTPYVVWIENNHAYVKTYQSGNWNLAGTGIVAAPADPDIKVNNGIVYISYFNNILNMSHLAGSSWVQDGGDISSGTTSTPFEQRMIFINSIPYVAWHSNHTPTNDHVYVKHLAGGDWQQDGNDLELSSVNYIPNVAITNCQQKPYVIWYETNSSNTKVYVSHLEGTDWTPDGTNLSPEFASAYSMGYVDISTFNGTPYIAMTGYNQQATEYQIIVKHLAGTWLQDGGKLNYSNSQINALSMAIADAVYVAWVENSNVYVRKFQLPLLPTATVTQTPTVTCTPTKAIELTVTFTVTPTASSIIGAQNRRTVMAYPNPAHGIVHFAWAETNAEKAKISIFNLSGERIATLTADTPGQSLDWNAAGVAPGIYIYRVALTVNGVEHQLPIQKLAILKTK